MQWRLLERILSIEPGESARAQATTHFPESLFADHFPTFPVAPGVLLIEMGAQLSGKLVQLTILERRGYWIFPILAMIKGAKFRRFVPPNTTLDLSVVLLELRPESALLSTKISQDSRRCADLTMLMAFHPEGHVPFGDGASLRDDALYELERLGFPLASLPPETSTPWKDDGG